ncbi:MAG: NACHT domain-containing protein [Planctomycetes bacterium]|nr:NACHT domain-containing protein [Planctomycetota bacterium]
MNLDIRIIILAKKNHLKGRLFNGLAKDVLATLGYSEFRMEVPGVGKEVDIMCRHQSLATEAYAECKGLKGKVHGPQLNKFFGVLNDGSTSRRVGYCFSLNGFGEPAISQEEKRGEHGIQLFGPLRIIDSLVGAGRLKSADFVAGAVSDVLSREGAKGGVVAKCILLLHSKGRAWAVFVELEGTVQRVALFSDLGIPLSMSQAEGLLKRIQSLAAFKDVSLLPGFASADASLVGESAVKGEYLQRLRAVCTRTDLAGVLGAGHQSTAKADITNLFIVPAIEPVAPATNLLKDEAAEDSGGCGTRGSTPAGLSPALRRHLLDEPSPAFGDLVCTGKRAMLGAPPGQGKSTALNALALAYAARTGELISKWKLSNFPYFPVLIRCREIADYPDESFTDSLIRVAACWALADEHGTTFRRIVVNEARAGRLLLLVDGIDELDATSSRQHFLEQLGRFLDAYPKAACVATTRDFLLPTLAPSGLSRFDVYRIEPMSDAAIEAYVQAWNSAKQDTGAKASERAQKFLAALHNLDSPELAANPLSLTSLLVTYDAAEELPHARAALYSAYLSILLRRRDTVGQPNSSSTSIPTLAYVAWHMLNHNKRRILFDDLCKVAREAQTELPESLRVTSANVEGFLRTVETRSGIIFTAGLSNRKGELLETYEFSHNSIQEYLAALAAIEGYVPEKEKPAPPSERLKHCIKSTSGHAVLPLAASLAGTNAQPIVELVLRWAERMAPSTLGAKSCGRSRFADTLADCIAEGAQVSEAIRKRSLLVVAKTFSVSHTATRKLAERCSAEFKQVVKDALSSEPECLFPLGCAMGEICRAELGLPATDHHGKNGKGELLALRQRYRVEREDDRVECLFVLATIEVVELEQVDAEMRAWLSSWTNLAAEFLRAEELFKRCAAVFALHVLARLQCVSDSQVIYCLPAVVEMWLASNKRLIDVWYDLAIESLPVVDKSAMPPISLSDAQASWIEQQFGSPGEDFPNASRQAASAIVSFYAGRPWSGAELKDRVVSAVLSSRVRYDEQIPAWADRIFEQLGEQGEIGRREFIERISQREFEQKQALRTLVADTGDREIANGKEV